MRAKLFVLFLAFVIVGTGLVSAVNLQVTSLEVNSHSLLDSGTSSVSQDYKRGDKLNIYVCVQALADVTNAQIYADISGYAYANQESAKITDMTDSFDLLNGHSDCFDLDLEVPTKIDKDYFKLRIRADDRNGTSVDKTYQLYLKGIKRNMAVEVKDFSLDPQEVVAGRAFTGKVKVKNLWDNKIKDLKVTMSVPDLNIKVSEYMDEIDPDQSRTFEELLLRIPECTKAGTYDVNILVEFDEYSETDTTGSIKVSKGDTCGASTTTGQGNTIVNVPNMQEVAQGTSVVYPIVINNVGANSKTYTLSVTGASTWATTRIDPSSVVVIQAGQSKTAYLYISSNSNAELGDKAFTLNIDADGDTKSIPLIAKITKSGSSDWSLFKQALEVGLVVLVVILIIVGLVIGFNKMRDNKNDSEPYY